MSRRAIKPGSRAIRSRGGTLLVTLECIERGGRRGIHVTTAEAARGAEIDGRAALRVAWWMERAVAWRLDMRRDCAWCEGEFTVDPRAWGTRYCQPDCGEAARAAQRREANQGRSPRLATVGEEEKR